MLSGRYTAVSGPHRLDLRVDLDGPRAQQRVSGDLFESPPGEPEAHFLSFMTAALMAPALQAPLEITHHPEYQAGTLSLTSSNSASALVTLTLARTGSPTGDVLTFNATRVDDFLRSVDLRVYAFSGLLPPDAAELDAVHRANQGGAPASAITVRSILEENGFRTRKPTVEILPAGGAGPDEAWSDAELHEALVALRGATPPSATEPWPFDLLVAPRGDRPRVLGVLFDTGAAGVGRAAAVFYNAIRSHQKVVNQSGPFAREYLFTCIHEIGHMLRLPHAWVPFGGVGTAERDDRALSFMAYPDNYALGYTRFYARFPFEFREEERLHLRHGAWSDIWPGGSSEEAPSFLQARAARPRKRSDQEQLRLELRSSGPARFRFGEPVKLELKLENVSRRPVRVQEGVLDFGGGGIQVSVTRRGSKEPARLLRPILLRDCRGKRITLGGPGLAPRALYSTLDLTFGRRGFNFLEPGWYSLTAAARLPERDRIASASLEIEVEPPTRSEERAAAEFLSPLVGLALTLGGDPDGTAMSRLREIAESSSLVGLAPWAALRLGDSLAAGFKRVTRDRVRYRPADPAAALRWLRLARECAGGRVVFPHLEWSRLLELAATCHSRLGQLQEVEKTVAQLSLFFASAAKHNRRLRRTLLGGAAQLHRRLRALSRKGDE